MEVRRLLNDVLEHHGVKGQHWGERRWQNEDGSLTPAGRAHYGYGTSLQKKIDKDYAKRKDETSYKESAKETIKKEKKSNEISSAVAGTGAVLAAAKVGSEVAAANSKLWVAKAAAASVGKAQAIPTVTSAIATCNPMTLAVASSAAITLTGYAIYNHYKNKKLKAIEYIDKIQDKLKNIQDKNSSDNRQMANSRANTNFQQQIHRTATMNMQNTYRHANMNFRQNHARIATMW